MFTDWHLKAIILLLSIDWNVANCNVIEISLFWPFKYPILMDNLTRSLSNFLASNGGKDEKFRMTNLEWGVDFFSLTNLVKTS